MNIPKNIGSAIMAIWATIIISAIAAAIEKQAGLISSDKFMFYLIVYGLCCIFPYKISKASNATRFIFAVLTAIGYLFMLGGETQDMTKVDIALQIIFAPVYGFIFYHLFSKEGNLWFSQQK